MQDRIGGLQHVPVEGEYAGMADYPVIRSLHHNGGTTIYQTRKLEKPSKRLFPNFFREREVPRLMRLRIVEAILELTKRGAGMMALFLLVTGVCQSLNEFGVVSVTKKWSGQNRTSRTACYGPVSQVGCHTSTSV